MSWLLSFLMLVAAVLAALVVLIFGVLFFIRWKFRSALAKFADVMKLAAAGGVPPFRVKLQPKADWFDEEEEEDVSAETRSLLQQRCDEFAALGFEKIGLFDIEGTPMALAAFVDRGAAVYGVVYHHPYATEPFRKVWCDAVRRYPDGSGWTYTTNVDSLMDHAPQQVLRYFPELPLAEVVAKLRAESPTDNAALYDDFPKGFERAYARDMDWRIERGGPTEAEIRRVAERDGTECTPEHVHVLQRGWRMAIANFQKERILKRYRKDAELSRADWQLLEEEGVVVYEGMQAEEILETFGVSYDPDSTDFEDENEVGHEDSRGSASRIEEIREQLKADSPQAIFRRLVESGDQSEVTWEFKASVSQPLPADIWLRRWKDADDDPFADDEDEADEYEDE